MHSKRDQDKSKLRQLRPTETDTETNTCRDNRDQDTRDHTKIKTAFLPFIVLCNQACDTMSETTETIETTPLRQWRPKPLIKTTHQKVRPKNCQNVSKMSQFSIFENSVCMSQEGSDNSWWIFVSGFTLAHPGLPWLNLAHSVSLWLKKITVFLCTIWLTLACNGSCQLTMAHSGSHRTKILAHVCSPKCTGTDCRSPPGTDPVHLWHVD